MVGFKKATYENVPAGSHPFRCYAVIDFGTQEREFAGEHYTQPEVNFLFEFPTELMADGRPFSCKAASFNFSAKITSKSKLMKFLKGWLPTEKIDDSFNFKKLIDKTGVANIVHSTSKDGSRTYANVDSVMPLMKGMEVPAMVNKPIYVSLDADWDAQEFAKLSTYYQDIIKESPEYNEIMDKGVAGFKAEVEKVFPGAAEKAAEDLNDEIPF